jgi:hypothetical protein
MMLDVHARRIMGAGDRQTQVVFKICMLVSLQDVIISMLCLQTCHVFND